MSDTDPSTTFTCSRFAPSTTGTAHPGTLLAGLLCWLDARAHGARVVLRLEDLDRERTRPGYVEGLAADLAWFGLDWDDTHRQSAATARHEAAVEALVAAGRVFACSCSRADIRRAGQRAPDGSFAYPGTCRERRVDLVSWRTSALPLRLRLTRDPVRIDDDNGDAYVGDAAALFGDPILRRRGGAFAYNFASIVDDAAAGVDRVVRGRDLAPTTLLQVALQRALGLPRPRYRHHLLLLERRDRKLSKFHGAVGADALRERYTAEDLCGRLAAFAGLVEPGAACRPVDLVDEFDWSRVRQDDLELSWSVDDGLQAILDDGAR